MCRAEALLQDRLLLLFSQWRKLQPTKADKAFLCDSSGARGHEQDVALRRKHLRHVPLNLLSDPAALVQAVEQDQRTPCCQRLA